MELRVAITQLALVCREQINNNSIRKQLDQLISITQNPIVTDHAIKQFILGINISSNQQYPHSRHHSFGQPDLQLTQGQAVQNASFTPVSNRILSQGFVSNNKLRHNKIDNMVQDKLKLKELSPKLKTDVRNVSPKISPQRYDNNSQVNQELKLNQNLLILKNNTKIEIPNRSNPSKHTQQEPISVNSPIQKPSQSQMELKSSTPHDKIIGIVKEAIQQFQNNSIRILTLYNYTDEIITCSSIRKSQDIETPGHRKYKNVQLYFIRIYLMVLMQK